MNRFPPLAIGLLLTFGCRRTVPADSYDIVLLNGRVMDPESGLDSVRNVGIKGGTIVAVSKEPLTGRLTIDVSSLVVAPGFIDIHAHGLDEENNAIQAADGVTTALDLEMGPADVDQWYAEREGKQLINTGVTVGYQAIRHAIIKREPGATFAADRAVYGEATDPERRQMLAMVERGLERGALGVGWHLNSTPGSSQQEVVDVFRIAHEHHAMVDVDLRYLGGLPPNTFLLSLLEVIGAAASTGAALHVCHVCSSAIRDIGPALDMMAGARARGMHVTTECHPYNAVMGDIQDTYFDGDFRKLFGIDYQDLQWVATGEGLTPATFAKYRKSGGGVIIHYLPDATVRAGLTAPFAAVISDGRLIGGRGHPRGAGTFARFLGHWVRDEKLMPLMDGLRKVTLIPAEELGPRVPIMKKKGRIQRGADADITVFDPTRIIDRATYEQPALPSAGIAHVLVNGMFVLRDGKLVNGGFPGRSVRAPVADR